MTELPRNPTPSGSTAPAGKGYAPQLRRYLPANVAGKVLRSSSYPALAAAFAVAERRGRRFDRLMPHLVEQGDLHSTRDLGAVMLYRLNLINASTWSPSRNARPAAVPTSISRPQAP